MGKTIIVKGQPYTMKYRPTPLSQIARYDRSWRKPLPMTGNPPEAWTAKNWDEWCAIVYQANMNAKRGIVVIPAILRRGLWHWMAA